MSACKFYCSSWGDLKFVGAINSARFDGVIHVASSIPVSKSISDPVNTIKIIQVIRSRFLDLC